MEKTLIHLPKKISGDKLAKAFDKTIIEMEKRGIDFLVYKNLQFRPGSVVEEEVGRVIELNSKVSFFKYLFTFDTPHLIGRISLQANAEYAEMEMESCRAWSDDSVAHKKNFESFLLRLYDNLRFAS